MKKKFSCIVDRWGDYERKENELEVKSKKTMQKSLETENYSVSGNKVTQYPMKDEMRCDVVDLREVQ